MYNKTTRLPLNSFLPVETFEVEKDKRYRVRLISAAMAYSLRVSIDNHTLHVDSTDGNDVEEISVESIIINSGERFDFWINTHKNGGFNKHWIRVQTLEYYKSKQVK